MSDLFATIIQTTVTDYAMSRGWNPDDPTVAGTIAAAVESHNHGAPVGEACEEAFRRLRGVRVRYRIPISLQSDHGAASGAGTAAGGA